jgi:two-component system, OmpR family, sensor histidine kinase KdpD
VRRLTHVMFAPDPPPRRAGVLTALLVVGLCTVLVFPFKHVAPVVSLGVVYLLAVLAVSVVWGAWLGVMTAVLSAAAFNFFHLPPTGQFTIADSENWVALGAFLVVGLLASSLAEVARARTREAIERRREADLAAEMARVLLRGERLADALPIAAARLADALDMPSAEVTLAELEGGERRVAFALREGERRLGTLLVPAHLDDSTFARLHDRVVPALEALLSAALEREALLGDVVETAALRRADVVKTALLRSVSHDLRSPLTAIVTAGEALRLEGLDHEERAELAGVIVGETHRLSRLVDNLLDLSRLQAGAAEPRLEWTSVEEVIRTALEEIGAGSEQFHTAIDVDLPLVRVDAAQLERALVNVLENARQHSGGHPVSVRARAVRTRLRIRVVDRGPGIPPEQLERVFEPFYRSSAHRGSGLGLAIARGFIEANGGRIHAESLPGQGSTFVIELPIAPLPPRSDTPQPAGARVA